MSRPETEVRKLLKRSGYRRERYGKGGHELWRHQDDGHLITVAGSCSSGAELLLVRNAIRRASKAKA